MLIYFLEPHLTNLVTYTLASSRLLQTKMASSKGVCLTRTDFPIYCIKSLGDRHFLIAGGGGQAKTGILNAIEIFELKLVENKIIAVNISRHDTGSQAVMNCSSFYDGKNHHLATGQDDECCLYSLKYCVTSVNKTKVEENSTKKRKTEKNDKDSDDVLKEVKFDVSEIKRVTTDFDEKDSSQKVVRFSPNQKLFATGGIDGHLRVWKYPECTQIFDIKAHDKEIDDIDICPKAERIATVSHDHNGYIWNINNGDKVIGLSCNLIDYKYRCCRYGSIEGKSDKYNLYTISIPVKRSSSKPSPCYIVSFDGSKYKLKKKVSTGVEILSSLAVSYDGIYIGVGTISGSVAVYISFSLQKLYKVNGAHNIFVTGVEFMPKSESCQAIIGDQDFTLLSVSADNNIKLHQVRPRSSFNVIWLVLGAIIIIYFIFWILAELGL